MAEGAVLLPHPVSSPLAVVGLLLLQRQFDRQDAALEDLKLVGGVRVQDSSVALGA
jgi:hypothetical protein